MIQYYLLQNSFLSAKYTLISNYYKNRRRLKHMYLKCMPINKTNESVILASITHRSLGKYTVSPGHSLLAHHRNASLELRSAIFFFWPSSCAVKIPKPRIFTQTTTKFLFPIIVRTRSYIYTLFAVIINSK